VLLRPVPTDVGAVWRIHRDPRAGAHNQRESRLTAAAARGDRGRQPPEAGFWSSAVVVAVVTYL
jgi:hypothetical protein